uniref:Uncharacterized protein n=1 Tax=Cacopsylla melanoneura TaxID=428564 RepID=A0A8D9FDV0_9HEMI
MIFPEMRRRKKDRLIEDSRSGAGKGKIARRAMSRKRGLQKLEGKCCTKYTAEVGKKREQKKEGKSSFVCRKRNRNEQWVDGWRVFCVIFFCLPQHRISFRSQGFQEG